MRRLALSITAAILAHTVMLSASAQEPGVGTPKAAPYEKVSPQEKAAGKAQRKSEGRAAAAAGNTSGEVTPQPAAQPKIPKEERQAARASRKAETARAAKAGELAPQGEVGAVK